MIDTPVIEEERTSGQKLRKARLDMGVNLEDVARTTRIAKRYLKALEEDAHEKLPSEAYARGFLRVYAAFLGLPEEDVISLYQRSTSGEMPEESAPVTLAAKQGKGKSGTAKLLLWSIAALCLAVAAGSFLLGDKENRVATAGKSIQPSPATDNAAVPPVQLPLSSGKRTEHPLQKTAEDAVIPANGTEVPVHGIILKMRVLEDGSLDLTIDETTSQHYDLKAGDLIEWKADKVFSLDLENAGGVQAELDGKILKPFGEKGAHAHIVLSAGYDGEKTVP
jgi:cytoskeleton protein RodZ